jgi:hypothetical protein
LGALLAVAAAAVLVRGAVKVRRAGVVVADQVERG